PTALWPGCLTQARRLAGWGFRPAPTAQEGTRPGPHPSAAPHGAEVQTGGNGRARGPGVPAGRGVSRGGGSNRRRGRERGRRPGRGEGGAGASRPRGPGAGAGRSGITGNPLTWVNTDSEGGVGCPAHLDVAPVTWGRASWGGSGLSGP